MDVEVVKVTRRYDPYANVDVLDVLTRLPIAGGTPEQHPIIVPLPALVNRRAVYGLATDEEALEAVLREHATRLNALPGDGHPDPRIARMGGLRRDVTVKIGDRGSLCTALAGGQQG